MTPPIGLVLLRSPFLACDPQPLVNHITAQWNWWVGGVMTPPYKQK